MLKDVNESVIQTLCFSLDMINKAKDVVKGKLNGLLLTLLSVNAKGIMKTLMDNMQFLEALKSIKGKRKEGKICTSPICCFMFFC